MIPRYSGRPEGRPLRPLRHRLFGRSRRPSGRPVLAILALLTAACSVDETPAPDLAGPSTFALNVVMSATPDNITQDGASQSSIVIDAKGPDGRPARYVPFRLEMRVPDPANAGALLSADFGRLSTKQPTTNDVGQALVTYTAPPRPSESTGTGVVVTIVATPVGSDYRSQPERFVDIRVIPPGVLVPPNRVAAEFEFTPTNPTAFTPVAFSAAKTASDGAPCGNACVYEWNFGDGGSGDGLLATHEFRSIGIYQVTLTATNSRGQSGATTKNVTVGAGQAPTADFAFSPMQPLPGQTIFFNASASRAASGRRIVSYEWDFGSGRSGSGVTVSKGYEQAGTYVVTLNVIDDANQVGTVSKNVPVGQEDTGGGGAAGPTADFSILPLSPELKGGPSATVNFNASTSTASSGAKITSYSWTFGDGGTHVGASPITSHDYRRAEDVRVTLVVTDDGGRSGSLSKPVTIRP